MPILPAAKVDGKEISIGSSFEIGEYFVERRRATRVVYDRLLLSPQMGSVPECQYFTLIPLGIIWL
jgi:hypothetical protein